MDQLRAPLLLSLVTVGLVLCLPAPGWSQSGTTLTPDRRTFLVNKDLGAERWTISAGLATDDVESVISVTGNVFRSDGGPPSFVLCQIRNDSTGSLSDPASVFRLTCQGTRACQTSARECARDEWDPIADAVEIPASFFLPPTGLGNVARVGAKPGQGMVATWVDHVVSWARGALGLPAEAVAQGNDRGATLSLDRLTYLVNKDIGGQRWSIGLNFVPVESDSGGATNELLSVTGNVFFPDGSEPSFVYCAERDDSTGTLEDAESEFRFRCSGASACGTTAEECAASAWTPIADDVRLGASFFLPPGGLPPSAQSDPEIFVIGRTSDPPAIVTREFTIPEGDGLARVAGGTCPVGATCLADRIGSCTQVGGGAVDIEGFGCGCQITDVPPACITCGGGATGSCGASGGYPVGNTGRMARGVCLPFSAESEQCVVYGVIAGGTEDAVVDSCDGPLGTSCPGERCCADDPRDGCDPDSGGTGCAGVCVSAGGCSPGSPSCGICKGEGGTSECRSNSDCGQGEFCGRDVGRCSGTGECEDRPDACPAITDPVCGCDGETYGNECEAAAAGLGVATLGECGGECGNGVVEDGEACDPESLPAVFSCRDFGGGNEDAVVCAAACQLDPSGCECALDLSITCECDVGSGVCRSSVTRVNSCTQTAAGDGSVSIEVTYPACGTPPEAASVTFRDLPPGSSELSFAEADLQDVCVAGEGEVIYRDQLGVATSLPTFRCDGSTVPLTGTITLGGWYLKP